MPSWFTDPESLFPAWKSELYDPSKPGMVHIQHFLNPSKRDELMQEALHHQERLAQEPGQVGKVYMEMDTLYFGAGEKYAWPDEREFPVLLSLKREYDEVFRRFSQFAHFQPGELGSMGIHHYAQGGTGITPHMDPPRYVNLVSIFVLKGSAPFGICKDREYTDKIEVMTRAGDLLLMRAPRSKEELTWRPFHYVGKVNEERWAVLFRQVKKD